MRPTARCSPRLLTLAAAVALLAAPLSRADNPTTQLGKKIDRFALKDPAGKTWALADLKDKKAIVIV